MNRRTKVLMLIKGLGVGGAEKLLQLGLRHWDRERFDYEVGYFLPWKDALVPDFQRAGIPVHCLNQRHAYDLLALQRLVRLIRQNRVDVLHLHLPYAGSIGRVIGRLAGVQAIIYTEHSLHEHHHMLSQWANRLTYSWNDATICVSEAVRQSVLAHCKLNGHPTLNTIFNGIDLEEISHNLGDSATVRQELGVPADHQIVVHVANFNPQKRHEDLMKAVQLVVRQNPRVTFLLVGHGRLQPAVKAQARELNITENVIFTGFRTDAPRLMAAGDLSVLSSQFEGLPISLLEAMALGRPVVATNVGGVSEVVTDGVEGFLVDPLDPAQLADKILALLRDPELRQRLSENARRRVREKFSIQSMVTRTEALYRQVLSKKVGA
jgi:glycosyltransferase involved in cell wall biosynthesis